ncbi:MAG TPA: hypothetical protein VGZ26_07435, partial [Pirellulales bacterium]|nr:hypothetical protein [Pirellulales bacterium]
DNLSGDANTRLLQMLTPGSLGLPMFTDDDQAQRAWRQATQIGDRLRAHDATMDRVILGMRATEIAGDVAGFAVGVGVVAKAFKTGGKWAVVKTVVAIGSGIAVEQGVEKGLRAAGAGEQTIRGARLAAAVVTFILIRRRSRVTNPDTVAPSSGSLRSRMGEPPAGMTKPEAHHDLPRMFASEFSAKGLDIEDPAFGRWVEGGPVGGHQRWSSQFNNEWRDFFSQFPANGPGPTREQILSYMNKLRLDPRFQ